MQNLDLYPRLLAIPLVTRIIAVPRRACGHGGEGRSRAGRRATAACEVRLRPSCWPPAIRGAATAVCGGTAGYNGIPCMYVLL
jgi:hypothetical protein